MRFGVVVFPGSNCDHDAFHAVGGVLEKPVEFIWHQSENLSGFDAVILPGGFSYGDYLRTGAIARFSPVMRAVAKFAQSGGLVLGICNGFQILCEAGLLPGALMRNTGLRFICRHVHIRVENHGDALHLRRPSRPGAAHPDRPRRRQLRLRRRHARRAQAQRTDCLPLLRAQTAQLDPAANPNGSLDAIAGICNRQRNVLGMMPHPERAVESVLGSTDGLVVFRSLIAELSRLPAVAGQPAAKAKVS